MADTTPNILVDADARTRVAVRPFLLDGGLNLALVAKATLGLVDQGPARFVDPAPIVMHDMPWQPQAASSIQRADDLALGKRLCDVTLVGSAFAPHGKAAPSVAARLALVRNGKTLVDKSVVARGALDRNGQPTLITLSPLVWEHAFGGTGAGAALADLNPVGTDRPRLIDAMDPQRPAGFGPIASRWPSRTAPVTAIQLKSLRSALPELPKSFPWSYFQSAPPDLQIPFLEGDEWILLEGFNAELPTLRTRIPGLKAFGFMVSPTAITPVALSLDTLAIDMHDFTVSIVYRGIVPAGPLEEIIIGVQLTSGSERLAPCDARSIRSRARPQPLTMPRPPRATSHPTSHPASLNETALPSDPAQFNSPPARNAGAPFAIASPVVERPSASAPPLSDAARAALLPWLNVRPSVAPAAASPRTVSLNAADLFPMSGASLGTALRGSAEPQRPPVVEASFRPPVAPPPAPPVVVSRPPDAPISMEALEPEIDREVTPPSRAALAAAELRNAGFSEERVQEIMRDFLALPA